MIGRCINNSSLLAGDFSLKFNCTCDFLSYAKGNMANFQGRSVVKRYKEEILQQEPHA